MVDYEKLYKTLFNGITDAIELIKDQNFGMAVSALINLQMKTEELYLMGGER